MRKINETTYRKLLSDSSYWKDSNGRFLSDSRFYHKEGLKGFYLCGFWIDNTKSSSQLGFLDGPQNKEVNEEYFNFWKENISVVEFFYYLPDEEKAYKGFPNFEKYKKTIHYCIRNKLVELTGYKKYLDENYDGMTTFNDVVEHFFGNCKDQDIVDKLNKEISIYKLSNCEK